jgi:dTMP kinase
MPDDPDPAHHPDHSGTGRSPAGRSPSPAAEAGPVRPGAGAGSARTVVVLGIDGAGKSTAARALIDAERAAGREAVLVRNPAGRRWLSRVASRLGVEVPARWKERFETVVRSVNVLVAHARAALFVRRVRHGAGGLVVMDRHLACQLVLREVRGLPHGRFLPWLARRLPAPDAVVLLDVPAEAAYARIHARGEDHEPLAYLQAARAAYLGLAATEGWHVIDATQSPARVAEALRRAAG